MNATLGWLLFFQSYAPYKFTFYLLAYQLTYTVSGQLTVTRETLS